MKIKYKFVDGTVAEIEVEESIGAVTFCSCHMISTCDSISIYKFALQYEDSIFP